MLDFILRYKKAIVAFVGTLVGALSVASQDGSISGADWIGIVMVILTPAGVAAVQNKRAYPLKSSVHDIIEE
jgi:hypothetical protein